MNDDSENIEQLTDKLNEASLGQNRFLSEAAHNYEQYSLPPTRPASQDASKSHSRDSSDLHQVVTPELVESTSSSSKRPSAAFLSRANDPSDKLHDPTKGRQNMFFIDNDNDDASPELSRDSSPQSPSLSAFPSADHDDPYARKYRPPQVQNLNDIPQRFVFKKTAGRSGTNLKAECERRSRSREKGSRAASSSSSVAAAASPSQVNGSDSEDGKRKKPQGSMMELKRFFKLKHHHKSPRSSESSGKSPARSHDSSSSIPKTSSSATIPFMEDASKKYGKIGRVLGSGAGGSVRLMKRSSDGTVFAVKEFREKHATETERDYNKKVTAEFCIGSTLHHPNVIETLDIIKENGRYYEVMEYCPYDFFAVVMSGKMTREEIWCAFKQILLGVEYLHEMGLAHRDLKLDNLVVTEDGILKLIDFGSAGVFRYPFEEDIVLARGVVGSDPYLAPEVLSEPKYDPRPADIWSIAVIFACMTLRRFPWKVPRMSDNSFRLFASEPDPGVDQTKLTASSEIKGSWRLLRLLPQESRPAIERMLVLDPQARAPMESVVQDSWVQSIRYCTLDKNGNLQGGGNHEHTLVPPEEAHLESHKKK